MSVEERLRNALADMEAMLNEGQSAEDAVVACAAEYGFKKDALRMRATRFLGDLTSLRARNLERADRLSKEHLAETAIDTFLVEEPESTFPDWFEKRVGRPPSKIESEEFGLRYLKHLTRNISFEL
mgnify:CR=1 FL=1